MLSLESRNLQVHVDAATVSSSPPTESFYASAVAANSNDLAATGAGLSRAKSLFSMAALVSENASDLDAADETDSPRLTSPALQHGNNRQGTMGTTLSTNSGFREALEPVLRKAREARQRSHSCEIADVRLSIASSVCVPYMALRHERPFLFDGHTYPLQEALAETLRVESLIELHKFPEQKVLQPLLDPNQRRVFHAAYDFFVTSFILPLFHSLAIAKNVFHVSSSEKIHYRYQAFPNIRIVRPGDKPSPPTCGLSEGYSIACLQFHIPLTPAVGSSALHAETHQGREDWHPLHAKSFGLGYLFDGARCLHFDLGNTTESTRVSLDFRVMMYRDDSRKHSMDTRYGDFPTVDQLTDRFAKTDKNYYDEAVIDLSRGDIVAKTNQPKGLLEPSFLLGAPFDIETAS